MQLILEIDVINILNRLEDAFRNVQILRKRNNASEGFLPDKKRSLQNKAN